MWSRPSNRTIAAAVLLGVTLGGCSDIYYDRRETISLVSGEATAANIVTQTIDPWSPASGNRRIAYNGDRARMAAECYRLGKVLKPVNAITTTSAGYSQSQSGPSIPCNAQASPVSAPAGGAIK
jgi:hypothetical protein